MIVFYIISLILAFATWCVIDIGTDLIRADKAQQLKIKALSQIVTGSGYGIAASGLMQKIPTTSTSCTTSSTYISTYTISRITDTIRDIKIYEDLSKPDPDSLKRQAQEILDIAKKPLDDD